MVERDVKRVAPSGRTYLVVLAWVIAVALIGMLMSFRAARFSSIAQMIDISDVPILHFMDQSYTQVFGAAIVAAAVFAGLAHRLLRTTTSERPRGRIVDLSVLAFLVIELWASRGSYSAQTGELEIFPMTLVDWLGMGLLVTSSIGIFARIVAQIPDDELVALRGRDGPSRTMFWRLGIVYLVGFASVAFYACLDHLEFWNASVNGGYEFAPFFIDGERGYLDLVLFSTSALFASIASLVGCGGYVALRFFSRPGREDGFAFSRADVTRHGAIIAGAWTFSATVPWMVKVAPEIGAGGGEIFPCVVTGVHFAVFAPLVAVGLAFLKRDFETCLESDVVGCVDGTNPRRSEYVFFAALLFLVYPLLRFLRPARRTSLFAFLTAVSIAFLVSVTVLVYKFEDWFEFEDWRGMLKAGQLPFLRVLLSLFCGFGVYLTVRRAFLRFGGRFARDSLECPWRVFAARGTTLCGVLVCLGLASAPFWGWGQIRRNVFARAFEFSDRHEFELLFLHWLFDADRDGYAAVLHGADPDDFDAGLVAGRLAPADQVTLPPDRFRLVDPAKAKSFPNVVVLFLEGVVPRAISAYGKRSLDGGVVATPHIDSIARDGAIFTQARCFYPSTWDAWVAVATGRYLRVSEMRHDKEFGSKYSRYNNLYKALDLAGVDRWCHADCAPYYDLLVPVELREREGATWQRDGEEFSTRVSSEEADRGIWRGDKRNERILAFLDDVRPGERFFLTEHMSDSHFPWLRTSPERARELGFSDGLEQYEKDARLASGAINDKFSAYYQVVTRVDAQIGEIIEKLKEKGVYDNTMIVIVGDHGCQFWEHEHLYYVGHLYEQSLRLPLIIKVPGIPGGRVSGEPVIQIDILPTLLELAGVEHVVGSGETLGPLPGRSLVPLLRGDVTEAQLRALRQRDMILTTHYDTLGVLSQFRHKLIFDRPSGTYLLFDLEKDPEEMVNLADDEPLLLDALLEKLRVLALRHRAIVGHINDVPRPLRSAPSNR